MSISVHFSEDPFKKEAHLKEIGVSEEILLSALNTGVDAANRCTPNHPPMAAGFYRFSETVKCLGDQMASLGWTRRDYKNFSTIVRADGQVAIAVATGDDGTGDLKAEVTTNSPKGTATYEAVELNLSLPLDDSYVADNERAPMRVSTWFLLHSIRDGKLFAELSLPKSIWAGYVVSWSPRIPLRTVTLDPLRIDISEGDSPVNPIVDIKKRDAI
jgi:hypothetical protein